MDYNLDRENKGFAKGPFFGAAAFIFIIIALFASISLQEHGTLGHWQIATFLLGTGLIAILLCLPYFLEGIIEKIEDTIGSNDSDAINKAHFELKEIRSQLDALALKIDKVPTVVDKIISESIQGNKTEHTNFSILEKIKDLETKLHSTLDQIEQNDLTPPLLPETDSSEDGIKEILVKLNEQFGLVQEKLDSFKEVSDPSVSTARIIDLDEDTEEEIDESPTSSEDLAPKAAEEILAESEDSTSDSEEAEKEEEISEPEDNSENLSEEQVEETQEIEEDGKEEITGEIDEIEQLPIEDISPKDAKESAPDPLPPEDLPEPKAEEEIEQASPQELDLGLPSPEETLRKVDALLASKDPTAKKEKEPEEPKTSGNNSTTTVVANVMIGIGNKPFLRGEGPGLSWDEGVSMNFIEIGKWAWSPPRKNASMIVQVYRNDKDPDKGGKVEVKPGQKLEITPDFS